MEPAVEPALREELRVNQMAKNQAPKGRRKGGAIPGESV